MPKVSPAALKEVEAALDGWRSEVRTAGLKPSARDTYLLHAEHFVRWLKDDFEPGARKR